jgi:hypothetical protein
LNAARLDSKLRYFATPSVRVLDGVRQTRRFGSTGDAQFSVAANGTLVYVPESRTPQSSAGRSRYSMALIDRQGGTQALAGLTGWFPRVSPDGRRLAVETVTSQGRGISVFTLDTPGSLSQLTVGGSHRFPVWSPDSQRVAYQSDRLDSDRAVFWQRIDRLEPAQRLTTPAPDAAHVPLAMSRDGRTLLFDEEQGPTHTLCALSLQDGTIQRFTDVTSNALISAALSRDGRWLAYSAHRSPRPASVIVEPFPRTGAKYVDVGQGDHPAWSSTGTELFYMRGDRFVTRRVISASGFSAGDAVEVPRPFVSYGSSMPRPYDIVPQNRIVASPVSEPEPPGVSIQVVLNWLDEVKRLVP